MTASEPNEMEIFSTGRKWKRLNGTKVGVIETQEIAEFEIIWTVPIILKYLSTIVYFIPRFWGDLKNHSCSSRIPQNGFILQFRKMHRLLGINLK